MKKILQASVEFKPGGYDGSIHVTWYQNEFKFIDSILDFKNKKILCQLEFLPMMLQ